MILTSRDRSHLKSRLKHRSRRDLTRLGDKILSSVADVFTLNQAPPESSILDFGEFTEYLRILMLFEDFLDGFEDFHMDLGQIPKGPHKDSTFPDTT